MKTEQSQELERPNSPEAEMAVLGSCLIDPAALPLVAATVQPGDFHDGWRGRAFGAMLALQERGAAVDQLTVWEEMGGDEKDVTGLTDLVLATPSSHNAEHYADVVARHAERRRLIDAAGRIALAARDGDPEAVQAEAYASLAEACRNGRRKMVPLSDLVKDYYDTVEFLARSDRPVGLPTGYRDLDALLGGLHRKDLVLLAARPGTGKTALAAGIARHAAQQFGARVGFWSLEMGAEQVTARFVVLDSGVPSERLRSGKLTQEDWTAFVRTVDALGRGMDVMVDDTPGLKPGELRARCLQARATGGLDLVVVDYLQLMRGDRRTENRRTEISSISHALKALAKDLDAPVLALSQLNRACESRGDKRPVLSDLYESGDLEHDADVVIFLYRDEMYNPNTETPNLADAIVAKHRNGPTGTVSLYFRKEQMEFLDAEVRRTDLNGYPRHFSDVL